jgi:glucose/arabinose dehydrogenase
MDIATHPDGSIYVATRNEILRLRDTKGTGTADEKTRLIHLETEGDYPHNGLSGLAFDKEGNLIFGLGETSVPATRSSAAMVSLSVVVAKGATSIAATPMVASCVSSPPGSGTRLASTWIGMAESLQWIMTLMLRPPCRMLHVVEGGDLWLPVPLWS